MTRVNLIKAVILSSIVIVWQTVITKWSFPLYVDYVFRRLLP